MTEKSSIPKTARQRLEQLAARRNMKMARSAHAYVRGSTTRFYQWLNETSVSALPQGPAIWICGDCHTGNLGPVANTEGDVEVQIRDLDQTVIGNPVHDVIRLALSLATAARGSDLPGVTTLRMIESLIHGYAAAVKPGRHSTDLFRPPKPIELTVRQATERTWRQLARERISDLRPSIPLGKRFWPTTKRETRELNALFRTEDVADLATALRHRPNAGKVKLLDAAYWVKGCSSLGRLRYAVLLDVDGGTVIGDDLCLMDIKEGATAAAPRTEGSAMPRDNAARVVEGARNLSPALGERMRAARLLERSVVVRELLPQDLKLDIERLSRHDAMDVARYLGAVVGKAHARQLDSDDRKAWHRALEVRRSPTLDAPGWLWRSVVELMATHEAGYLEHCRRYALG